NGQRWDFVDAAFKESGIILTSEFGEFTNMGGGVERCARFVEPDVAISSNAQKLQVDTAGCCNFLIVVINRADSGGGRCFRNVDLCRLNSQGHGHAAMND